MNPKTPAERNSDTGLAITLIFALLSLFLRQNIFIYFLIGTLVLTMVNPRWCFLITPLWFGLSRVLGAVVSKILYTLIFVIIATPIGVTRKLLGKDTLGLKKFHSPSRSAFRERNYVFNATDLKTPY